MVQGEIYTSDRTKHPIIFWEETDSGSFNGILITHSSTEDYSNNIKLKTEHFQIQDESGHNYEIIYDESYIINLLAIKKGELGPYTKKGCLSELGRIFVSKNLTSLTPMLWVDYIETTR